MTGWCAIYATLSTGDLEALRALLHPDGSWEVMGLTIPGAGLTEGAMPSSTSSSLRSAAVVA